MSWNGRFVLRSGPRVFPLVFVLYMAEGVVSPNTVHVFDWKDRYGEAVKGRPRFDLAAADAGAKRLRTQHLPPPLAGSSQNLPLPLAGEGWGGGLPPSA